MSNKEEKDDMAARVAEAMAHCKKLDELIDAFVDGFIDMEQGRQPEHRVFDIGCNLIDWMAQGDKYVNLKMLVKKVLSRVPDAGEVTKRIQESMVKEFGALSIGGPLDVEWLRREAPELVEVLRKKAEFKPGDALYTFCTDESSWVNLAGRCGYVIVRNGIPVGYYVNVMS